MGSLGAARVKDLQGCWTGRGKADLDRHEPYILRFFSPYTFFFHNCSYFKYKECCFKAKQVKVSC